jgi:tRNA-2-methylthio-N6-dimethylallyladenosine synthase
MVEGKNESRGQWVGRTSQNKVLNFTTTEEPTAGSYVNVQVIGSYPNSLLGRMVI